MWKLCIDKLVKARMAAPQCSRWWGHAEMSVCEEPQEAVGRRSGRILRYYTRVRMRWESDNEWMWYGGFRHIPDRYRLEGCMSALHVGNTVDAVQPMGAAACAYFEVAAACM
jgi:hypothetical protein